MPDDCLDCEPVPACACRLGQCHGWQGGNFRKVKTRRWALKNRKSVRPGKDRQLDLSTDGLLGLSEESQEGHLLGKERGRLDHVRQAEPLSDVSASFSYKLPGLSAPSELLPQTA
jgi:hypothetical protein